MILILTLDFALTLMKTMNKFPKAELILEAMEARGVTYAQLAELCQNESNKTARNLYAKIRGDRRLTVTDAEDILRALRIPWVIVKKFKKEWKLLSEKIALERINPSPEAIKRFKRAK